MGGRPLRLEVPLLLALAGALVASVHCGGDDTTGHPRVRFPVSVRGINPTSENPVGWRVTVEHAYVALGPVRWYEGAPIFGRNLLERLLGVGVAYAHPGHYVPGEALADITAPRVVDLMATEATPLGGADGVAGDAQSARVELHPPDASLGVTRDALHGLALWTRGTATRAGTTVRFEGGVAVDYAVRGVPARAALASTGRFVVSVDLARWFDQVDFSGLAEGADGSPAPIAVGSVAANGLYRGATNGASYVFAWQADAGVR